MTDLDTDAAAAHQLFASLGGMEGLDHAHAPPPSRTRRIPGLATLQATYPGLLAAGVIGLAATWLSQHYQAPVMLFALLIGMAFHFLHEEGRCVAGIEFSSKAVLRLGVALLGARITAAQILSLGVMPIATVVVGVGSTIALGFLASRLFGQSRSFGVLSGGAVGICGASAALAVASVLPRTKESERDTILAVVTVTALSTIAMITYPMIVAAVGLNHVRAGIFLGGTIHDVAQVVGAGYTISPQTGDIATYVKLLRVTLLLPVVFAIAVIVARGAKGGAGKAKAPVPWFLFGFALLVLLNSLGLLAKPVTEATKTFSSDCLVVAIAALGMKTSFKDLVAVGWRPVALMVLETAWIATLVLAAVLLFA
ncbi:MAG TPA: putative sulfate exporter family transporter [Caulobacteraceae bacterium]|nr:putative sulfate exporter family transporter [Caulobacteraceae bacterium]